MLHINYKEVLAIYFAAKQCATSWSGHHIVIHSDNMAAVAIINKDTCKNKVVMAFLRDLFRLSAICNFRITAKYIPGHKNIIADAISRLHDGFYLNRFCQLLSPWYYGNMHGYAFITAYTCLSFMFLFFRYFGPFFKRGTSQRDLYRSQTFSENTEKTYQTNIDSYLRFCLTLGISSIPASTDNIALYAAFLARSLKPSSVRQYLYVIGLLHIKEFSLPNPLIDNWFLDSLFKGIKRVKGDMIVQKLPITIEILLAILKTLDFRSSFDSSFWAVCLTAFLACFGNHIYLLVI